MAKLLCLLRSLDANKPQVAKKQIILAVFCGLLAFFELVDHVGSLFDCTLHKHRSRANDLGVLAVLFAVHGLLALLDFEVEHDPWRLCKRERKHDDWLVMIYQTLDVAESKQQKRTYW